MANLTPTQRDTLISLQQQIGRLERALRWCSKEACNLREVFALARPMEGEDLTPEEIERLVRLNDLLRFLEAYLHARGQALRADMEARVADPNDPLDDFEIDATLSFVLRDDDPDVDDASDNILTERSEVLKLGSDPDRCNYRDRPFPGRLNEVPHCWMFHDLCDHSYGLKNPALSLRDCLRIGRIWVEVAVRHQATLDVDSGAWLPPSQPPPSRTPSDPGA